MTHTNPNLLQTNSQQDIQVVVSYWQLAADLLRGLAEKELQTLSDAWDENKARIQGMEIVGGSGLVYLDVWKLGSMVIGSMGDFTYCTYKWVYIYMYTYIYIGVIIHILTFY